VKRALGLKLLTEYGSDEYIKQIVKYPLLNQKEFSRLFWAYRRGSRVARRRILEGNLRLVVKIAGSYLPVARSAGLDFQDLVEEGNIGLIRALEKYKPRMRIRFSTYATYWIHESIRRAISEQSHTIRIPAHIQSRLKLWQRKYQRLSQKLGRVPSTQEMATELKLDDDEVSQLLADLRISFPQKSLENPITDDSNVSLEDVLGDENRPFSSRDRSQQIGQEVAQAVAELSPADQKLLTWRYGLNNTTALTLAEIGRKLKISRERVRQLVERALRRLRKVMTK